MLPLIHPEPNNCQCRRLGRKTDLNTFKSLICLKRYPAWNWIVGAAVNIENIEVESQRELEKIVETLNKTLEEITIGMTGFAFIFDNAMRVLAMTDQSIASKFQICMNTDSRSLLLENLVTTAIKGRDSLSYRCDLFKTKR